jgi:UrcA family protein
MNGAASDSAAPCLCSSPQDRYREWREPGAGARDLIILNDIAPSPVRSVRYSFHAIQTHSGQADIDTVATSTATADNPTSLFQEIAMSTTMTTTLGTLTILIASALGRSAAGAAGSLPIQPSAADETLQSVVRFPDLDLSTSAGAASLYSRLRRAAGVVCAPLESANLRIAAKHRSCMDTAIADAVAKVNRPLLTQYHESHFRGEKTRSLQLAKAE